jgi:hypothetical protein
MEMRAAYFGGPHQGLMMILLLFLQKQNLLHLLTPTRFFFKPGTSDTRVSNRVSNRGHRNGARPS